MSGHRVYIGHLATDSAERDLKDLFKDFGKIRDVTIKNRFGFVEFDDRRDAEDAVREFHGTKFMGQR
jgi:arginine/serine-rich splicing factor 4/5/6